ALSSHTGKGRGSMRRERGTDGASARTERHDTGWMAGIGRRRLWLIGLLAGAALAALPGASLAGGATAAPTPVVMTFVCVNGNALGQMSFPVGGSGPPGTQSFSVTDPPHVPPPSYLQGNRATPLVSGSPARARRP